MKIAFIAPRYHTNQISMMQYLLKKNEVALYVTRISKIEDHSLLKPIIVKLNIIFKILKFIIGSNDPLFDYRYGFPSIKELLNFKSENYDLVIVRDPINLMSFIYFLWAKLNKIKTVFYIQKKVHSKNTNKIKDLIYKLFLKIFNEQCFSPCFGNSKFKKFSKNLTYLPFCEPVKNYKKKWFLKNRVNIISVGKFVPRKNHLLLIQALMNLEIKVNYKLTIVGECSTNQNIAYLNKVKRKIKENNLPAKVLINVNFKKINSFYKQNDLFVLPSVNEPASISNLEAMSFGLPVITSDTNFTSCYTLNNVNGFVVKSNCVKSLKDKIEFLLKNKKIIKKFSKKSFFIVKTKHDANIIYKKYFDKILNIEKNKLNI